MVVSIGISAVAITRGESSVRFAEHVDGATSHAVRHLRNKHNVNVETDEVTMTSRAFVLIGP
jgi:hypothetical protein